MSSTPIRRRLVGYSPIAVSQQLLGMQTSRNERLRQLTAQLSAARAETASLHDQLLTAQAELMQALTHSRELHSRIFEHLNSHQQPLLSFRERNGKIDAALAAERDRVQGILQRLERVQSRFGADMDGLMHRYREATQSLRQELPGAAATPEEDDPEGKTPPLFKKSTGP